RNVEERFDDYGSDYVQMCEKVAHSIGKKPAGDGPIPLVLHEAQQSAPVTPDLIEENFPKYDGKPAPKPRMLIEGFLMGGVNFFGSHSGVGKTWIGLAVTKALVTGEALFGVFPV